MTRISPNPFEASKVLRLYGIVLGLLCALRLASASDGDALLRAIEEAPGDDTPRLVYADWLDEQGQAARAEFIRAQIEMWKLPRGSVEQLALQQRVETLLQQHEEEWLPAGFRKRFPKPTGLMSDVNLSWERGFPAELVVPAQCTRDEANRKMLNALPFVHTVRPKSEGTDEDFAEFFKLDVVRRAAFVHLANRFGSPTNLRSILETLPNVRGLGLFGNPIAREAIQAIIDSGVNKRLVALTLQGANNSTVVDLFRSGAFPKLHSLRFQALAPHASVVAAGIIHLPELKELIVERYLSAFRFNSIDFLNSPSLYRLRSLTLPADNGSHAIQIANAILHKTNGKMSLTRLELFVEPPNGGIQPLPEAMEKHLEENRQRLGCAYVVQGIAGF